VMRRLLRRAETRATQAERRARQSERLAELGTMTGGLAHEIKNPLSTVLLNAQLLKEGLDDAKLPEEEKSRLQRRLDSLSREVQRLRDILTDFLQYAGRIKLDRRPVDLGALLEDLVDFFLPQCEQAGVVLRLDAGARHCIVTGDEGLLKQALLNLMINAVQAMVPPMHSGTSVPSQPPTRQGELILKLVPGQDSARIHVIDTGPGIPVEQRESIFLPYVSGKAGGSGLGLPTARRIVEEHGGRIDVLSELGRGSDFIVVIPRSVDPAPATEGAPPSTPRSPAD